MAVSVPTQADFDALAARVTALERGQPSESAQGTTIKEGSGTITLADGTKVTLVSGQFIFNGQVDPTTARITLGLMWDHKLHQQNADNNWWYGTKGNWTAESGDPRVVNPNYHVSNGQIIGPNGQPFKARGVNIWADSIPQAVPSLTTTFPGINYVRLNFSDQYGGIANWTPAKLKPYVDDLTAKGIVVCIDPHDYPTIYVGDQLTRVLNFMKAQVQTFKDNTRVWYETQNEPGTGNGGAVALTNMLTAIYTTCRNAGAKSPILIGGEGMYTIDAWTGIDHKTWSTWAGVVWALHYYNWGSSFAGSGAPSYSTDLATNKRAVANLAAALRTAYSADGMMPVIIDEYGDSTNGNSVDVGWRQTLQAVHESDFGTAAWNWTKLGDGDVLLNPPPSTLTPYGTVIRDWIRS